MIYAVMRRDETDEAIIKRHDREARGAIAERKPIEARALTRLREIVKEIRNAGRAIEASRRTFT